MYLAPSEMQRKDAIALAYEDSLKARAPIQADSKAAKRVQTYEREGDIVEGKEDAGVPKIINYFIFSELSEK